ncbi:MAG: ABC transporter permease [Prevotella sp.]|nr:ABC transporter permease [Prevotella sp.]
MAPYTGVVALHDHATAGHQAYAPLIAKVWISALKYFEEIISEFKTIAKDEGVMLFFFFLPLVYPLLYSWIYNNEVARDVPIVVVDDSHSVSSREFIRRMDATPEVSVALHCGNMTEAKRAVGHGDAYGILYFPKDFDKLLGRMEQAHLGVYCDMSYMLTYKAILVAATNISLRLGAELHNSAPAVEFRDVPIFNTTGGYGNFIIPGVLILIIQQAMLLGVGMLAGTRREKYPNLNFNLSTLFGRATTYFLLFAVMLAWITLIVPRIFGFVSLVHAYDLAMLMLPYLLACVFFAIAAGNMVRYRENVMLIVVFTSVPILFLSGVSWPQSSIPAFLQGVSWIFPSTFAIRGFVRMSSMGALLGDCLPEYIALWIQAIVYIMINITLTLNKKRCTD